jgi:O-antigen ligase
MLLCLVSLYPLAQFYVHRVQIDDHGSAASRKHLSLIAWETIQKRPLMGHGAGNCHLACRDVADQSIYRAKWYYTVHCKYLVVWVETGIIGLLLFLIILASGFRQGISVWKTRDPELSVLGLAFVAALAGHMLHMSVDIFNSRSQVQILWFMLGLTAATYKIMNEGKFRIASRPSRFPRTSAQFQAVGTPSLQADVVHAMESIR